MLREGQSAPDFALVDEHEQVVTLQSLAGHWVLLWWYPKAATPG